MQSIRIWTNEEGDYKLLDSGNKKKLEKIREFIIERSEPRAWWQATLPEAEWEKAYKIKSKESFNIEIAGFKAVIKFSTTTKHIGIFPEQASQWRFIEERVKESSRPIKILNLFGYTGMASLAGAKGGAEVTHVDGSRTAISWAKENQLASGLEDKPIRWILDDAVAFLKREVKRGVKYDGIIMDPPSYGKGPKGEVWKIEEQLPQLLELGRQVLSEKPIFFILNMYSTELSSLSLENLMEDTTKSLGGTIQVGELVLKHETSDRLMPMSITAIWQSA